LVQEIKTDLTSCSSIFTKIENYVIGNDQPQNAFIVLRIQMLPGRMHETKDRLGKILLKKIYHDFSSAIEACDTQVRVYLTETDKQHYYGLS
jgi:5-carboxymethyl-2-hydroxymuconate isomerase